MKWSEFKDYLVGISPDTPLGRVVAIRAEDNPEVLKNFTREQKRIRSEWYNKRAKMVTHETMDSYLDYMKKLFIGMAKS